MADDREWGRRVSGKKLLPADLVGADSGGRGTEEGAPEVSRCPVMVGCRLLPWSPSSCVVASWNSPAVSLRPGAVRLCLCVLEQSGCVWEGASELPDVQFTEEEEAIKLSLMENEPLPPEVLDSILSEWWFKEPIRSTGFILDGFPRYPDEAQFLGERGFFLDVAAVIQVEDQDVFDRLLPGQIQKWKVKQQKKAEKKKLIKDMKTKIREEMIAKRRAELISERDKKRGPLRDDEDFSDEDLEDEEDIDNILEEEFPKDEEEMSEEDEEQEAEATERLRNELGEKFEADTNNLQIIQEEFEKVLVPIITVNGARKIHIVQYVLNLKVKPLVENRASIFEKCYPVSSHLAHKMLAFTYKYMSSFGYWDPVKLSEGETIKPVENVENPLYPVIHRQYIYFLSSKTTREKFMMNPIKYIRQPKPKATMPVKIMIVGPPKSGKTTVAKKLASEYGLKHLSVGDALRGMLNDHPDSELSLMINWHLHKGMTVPDGLAVQALDTSLLESVCNTIGFMARPGGGGAHLYSQHSGGRGRRISVSLRPAWATE